MDGRTDKRASDGWMDCLFVCWLVGWLCKALRPFETVFQSISGRLPERGRKKREKREKNCSNNSHPHLLQAQ